MSDVEAARMFEQAVTRHAPTLRILAEDESHRSFLGDLFVAGSPLRGVLPDPIVQHQAAIREAGYRADFPAAMRRIVVDGDTAIGRIMVDWADDAWLIDIALLPERQGAGTGTALLRAYLDVADARRQRAMLQVMHDSLAQRLYARLGFEPVEATDFAPHLDMVREPRG